nr:unnamed protein product [Callosobruchus analis]CAI5852553.1 unnamed protein product [Callosobruchus analis]
MKKQFLRKSNAS